MSDNNRDLYEKMYQPSPEQMGEVQVLVGVSELLISCARGRFSTANRNKLTTAGENIVLLSQGVEIYPDDGIRLPMSIEPIKPEGFEELEDGSWFKKYVELVGRTSLWVRPETDKYIRNFKGSWLLPNREANQDDRSVNRALMDPFNIEIVEPDNPEYESKWDEITDYIIRELDDNSEVYYQEVWSPVFLGEREDKKRIETKIGYSIAEVVKIHPVRGDEEFMDDIPVIQMIFHKLNEDGGLDNTFQLSYVEERIALVDLDSEDDSTGYEIMSPYAFSDTLVCDLAELAIVSFESEV